MTRNYFAVCLLLLIVSGCTTKGGSDTVPKSDAVEETAQVADSTDSQTCDNVEYILPNAEEYRKQGFILSSKLGTYNDSLDFIVCLPLPELTEVEVLQRTKAMIEPDDPKDICSSAYFLLVKYQGQKYITDGSEVFVKDDSKKFAIKGIEIFPVEKQSVGVSYEGDLIGCDDYSPLILKEGSDFYLIDSPRKDSYYARKNAISYFHLHHDDGMMEEIRDISVNNDTIVLKITADYHEGHGEYDLNIVKVNNEYISSVSNKKEYEED